MKIAYLISLYPAMSHTFILREVFALRARGVVLDTFSVRQAQPKDILGPEAEAEAQRTRHLLPAVPGSYLRALLWALTTRPTRLCSILWDGVAHKGLGLRDRVMWLIYGVEAVQLAHWIVQGGYTHLHCHFGNPGSNTAWLAARLAGVPFSMTLHGIDMDEPERFRLPEKIADATFTACISQFGKAKMMYVTPPSEWARIRVVRCGLQGLPEPTPAPPGDSGKLVCVARLSVEKGHLILFEALAALRDEGVNFSCTLVGDGPMRAELEARVAALDLSDRIIFAGAQPPAQVAGFYAAADAAVLASFGEGIPLVLMEAMAHGRPVVSTRVGGIPELVEPGVTGLLVAPGSVREMTTALRTILRDPASARAMGERGREAVLQRFSIDVAAERLEQLFRGESAPKG